MAMTIASRGFSGVILSVRRMVRFFAHPGFDEPGQVVFQGVFAYHRVIAHAAPGPEDILTPEGIAGVQGETVVKYAKHCHFCNRGSKAKGCGLPIFIFLKSG